MELRTSRNLNLLTSKGYSEKSWYWISISISAVQWGSNIGAIKQFRLFFATTFSLLSFSSGAFNGLDKIVSRRKNEKYLGEFFLSPFLWRIHFFIVLEPLTKFSWHQCSWHHSLKWPFQGSVCRATSPRGDAPPPSPPPTRAARLTNRKIRSVMHLAIKDHAVHLVIRPSLLPTPSSLSSVN